jgi:hypothetical protein
MNHFFTLSLDHTRSHSITRSLDHSITRSLDHSITRSLDHSITRSLDHSITRSLDHSIRVSDKLRNGRAASGAEISTGSYLLRVIKYRKEVDSYRMPVIRCAQDAAHGSSTRSPHSLYIVSSLALCLAATQVSVSAPSETQRGNRVSAYLPAAPHKVPQHSGDAPSYPHGAAHISVDGSALPQRGAQTSVMGSAEPQKHQKMSENRYLTAFSSKDQ